MKREVAIIGCGNLGKSILKGLIKDGSTPLDKIIVTRRESEPLDDLIELGVEATYDNRVAIKESKILIFCVKPYNTISLIEAHEELIDYDNHTIISVAAGLGISELVKPFKNEIPIFRVMPNTSCEVGESITTIATQCSNSEKKDEVISLFNKVGDTLEINEELMEATTILGACGIAFVMRFIRAMTQGGIQIGLSSKNASKIVNQAVKGAAELLITSNEHAEYEIDKVTTPKGCTIVGLNEMEHNGFSSSLIKGINKSFDMMN